jgi:hypothetical protein
MGFEDDSKIGTVKDLKLTLDTLLQELKVSIIQV